MKKKLPIVIALVAAVSLFSITTLAFTNEQTGYETLKEALQSAKQLDNATFDVQVEVIDNGELLIGANAIGKADHISQNASGQVIINVAGLTKTADFYKQGDTNYFVDQDNDLTYQMNESNERVRGHADENFEMTTSQEAFVDYLAGDLKNQIGLEENADGTRSVTLDLDQEEIPMALNLMISAAASSDEHRNRMHEDQSNEKIHDLPFFDGLENLETKLPELKEDVKVTGIQGELTLDEQNQVVAYDFSFTIEGKEVSGTAHIVTINSAGTISDVDQTVVDTIDLAGKDVQIIDCEKEEN